MLSDGDQLVSGVPSVTCTINSDELVLIPESSLNANGV